MECLGIVRTAISRHVFWRRCSLSIEPEGAVGLAVSHGDALVPLPSPYYQIQLKQWPFYLLELSLGRW